MKHIGFISGHMGYRFAQPLMDGRFSFTFLRDPADRVLSMYYFSRGRDPAQFNIYQKAQEMDLPTFLRAGFTDPWVRSYIWNHQAWQVAHGWDPSASKKNRKNLKDFSEADLLRLAKKHIRKFSYVGFTETFVSDARIVFKALRLPEPEEMPVSNITPERPSITDQPSETKALLDSLTEVDRELYDYAWKQTRWRRLWMLITLAAKNSLTIQSKNHSM